MNKTICITFEQASIDRYSAIINGDVPDALRDLYKQIMETICNSDAIGEIIENEELMAE